MSSPIGSALLTAYGTQALSATVIGLLLVHFYRRYQKEYLLEWYASWFALLLYHGSAALDVFLVTRSTGLLTARLAIGLMVGIGAVLQCYWFVSGSYRLAKLRPMRATVARRALLSLIGVGMIVGVALALVDDIAGHLLLLLGFHALTISGAFLLGSRMVSREREHAAFTMLIWVCRGYVVLEVVVVAVTLLWYTGRVAQPYPLALGIGELLVQFALGLAMIVSLLEDEREAARLAASEIEHLAYHDGLTGLPNRALFFDRLMVALAHSARVSRPLAVLFVDLDRFKEVNDSLGHSSGDALLRTAANRIRETVRSDDTVARFGGDEFTLILSDLTNPDEATQVARKIADVIRAPYILAGREVVVTASIGISVSGEDGTDAESLVKNADTAMYRAKESGRDQILRYVPEMNATTLERLELETSLRRALAEQQLVVYYQPLYDIRRGRMFGMEALLRWRHPQLGILGPVVFIPAAEASGLIVPIGAWVLREACRQARAWRDDGLDLIVAVNLSGRQLQHPGIIDDIELALEESMLAPEHLEVEITETVAVQDIEQTLRVLNELRSRGVRVSIDDFGTGYSSLSYLKQFPVDTIKLDRSFVRDITAPQDAAIARSIIAMAHSLSMKVLAEGVETEHQLQFLQENRCDRLQGFFYSMPLSAEAMRDFIERNRGLFERM